jgi:hypothetical protein
VEHPFAQPVESFHPWRAVALVASAVAGAELIALMIAGVALLDRSLSHQGARSTIAHVARPAAAPQRAIPRPVPAGKPKLSRAHTSVLVLNGNGVAGAAAAASTQVRALGYVVGGVGNATRSGPGPSAIMYRPGYRAEGLRLGRDLHVATVGPLDGLRVSDLLGARVAYVVGSG